MTTNFKHNHKIELDRDLYSIKISLKQSQSYCTRHFSLHPPYNFDFKIFRVIFSTCRSAFTALLHIYDGAFPQMRVIWYQVFQIEPSKICGREPLTKLRRYGLRSNFLRAVFHKFHLVHSWILGLEYGH